MQSINSGWAAHFVPWQFTRSNETRRAVRTLSLLFAHAFKTCRQITTISERTSREFPLSALRECTFGDFRLWLSQQHIFSAASMRFSFFLRRSDQNKRIKLLVSKSKAINIIRCFILAFNLSNYSLKIQYYSLCWPAVSRRVRMLTRCFRKPSGSTCMWFMRQFSKRDCFTN